MCIIMPIITFTSDIATKNVYNCLPVNLIAHLAIHASIPLYVVGQMNNSN